MEFLYGDGTVLYSDCGKLHEYTCDKLSQTIYQKKKRMHIKTDVYRLTIIMYPGQFAVDNVSDYIYEMLS